mgnify:FL=1
MIKNTTPNTKIEPIQEYNPQNGDIIDMKSSDNLYLNLAYVSHNNEAEKFIVNSNDTCVACFINQFIN